MSIQASLSTSSCRKGKGRRGGGVEVLAIHEFGQGEMLGNTVKTVEPASEWTRKITKETVGIDAAIQQRDE